MNQTSTIYPKASYGKDGREVFSSGSTEKCRFQPITKRKLLPNGSVLIINAIAYYPPDVTIATDYKVVYAGVDYKVIDTYPVPDGAGRTDHIKVELQKWQ